MKFTNIPPQPPAETVADQERIEHTALRKRLLSGYWEDDLIRQMEMHLPTERREAWGPPDLSSNPFKSVVHQLSVLYSQAPTIWHENADAAAIITSKTNDAGFFALMQRGQQLAVGLREVLVRIDAGDDGLVYRLVTPDMVSAEADADRRDEPVIIKEFRLRQTSQGAAWFVDVLDIRDPDNPKYEIRKIAENGEIGDDYTQEITGRILSGSQYPFRYQDGRPFLPYQLYHAEKTGHLWDAYHGSEQIWGTLQSGLNYSFFAHCVQSAAWPQRYISGCIPAGLDIHDPGTAARRASVVTDPASILVFASDDSSAGQAVIGQWAAYDVEKLLQAISQYEARVATFGGISPAEIMRGPRSDPRSGYAISITRAGQREAARKYQITFKPADQELLGKSAALCNLYYGDNLPESGYRVRYHALPLSGEEKKSQLDSITRRIEAGLLSPVDALIELYDYDRDEAVIRLDIIRRERAQFS